MNSTLVVEDGRPGPTAWHVSVAAHPKLSVDDADDEDEGEGDEPPQLLWMDGWTFALGTGIDLADRMDEISSDAEVFAPLVDGDELTERLTDELDITPFGNRLVLINHVHLLKELRNQGGIGRYLAGLAVRQLDSDAGLVALHAAPFELRDQYGLDVPHAVWEAGAEALGRLWESIGFRRFDGHLYVLDPAMITLDEATDSLARGLRDVWTQSL